MPFATSRDADVRLVTDNSRLTPQEVRDLMPWMRQISEAGMRRMNAPQGSGENRPSGVTSKPANGVAQDVILIYPAFS